jgi:lycopene cyclase domain-containing protein
MTQPSSSLSPKPTPSAFWMVLSILAILVVPAALTLHRIRVAPAVDAAISDPSPRGYTVSLLLFAFPIVAIALWFLPREGVKVSQKAFAWTIGLLFPVGAALDFFFARRFFTYSNPAATLGWTAPALGGGVPVEEYAFYFTGFVAVLLIYIWLDEYWLTAYSIPVDSTTRTDFSRLLRFHPWSLILAILLAASAIAFRLIFVKTPGFPGYFLFLVVGALGPSAALLPAAMPVINWRAFSITSLIILLISLLWEATLGVPYRWWGFQDSQMIGIHITAWSNLPIEEIFVWISVTFATVIVYEILRRWKSSGKRARHAFFGNPSAQ